MPTVSSFMGRYDVIDGLVLSQTLLSWQRLADLNPRSMEMTEAKAYSAIICPKVGCDSRATASFGFRKLRSNLLVNPSIPAQVPWMNLSLPGSANKIGTVFGKSAIR